MKKLVYLSMCLVLIFSVSALAAEGNPYVDLSNNVDAFVEIGPYASVIAQKVKVNENNWWYRWTEADPGMDFRYYTGAAGYGKMADSNSFIIETNTALTITFSGESLAHELGDKMLTRYWAWLARGVDDLPQPYLFFNIPKQIQPYEEIGFFGEKGKAPRKDSGREYEQIIFDFLRLLTGREYWPIDEWANDVEQTYEGITTNGFYAFQVFGFASTDEISSQRSGDYKGKIILTVSK